MRVVRRGLGWALGLTLAVVTAAHAQSGEPPADSGGGPIPLAEVAARAAEIRSLLETQDVAITPSREVQTILERLPALGDELRVRLDQTAARLGTNPPLPVIEQLGSVWEATRARLKSWNEHHDPVDDPRRAGARSSHDPPGELEALPGGRRGLGRAQGRPRPDRRGREPARRGAYPAGGTPLRPPRHPVPAGLAPATVRRGLSRVAQVRADRIRRLGERDGPPLWSAVLWKGAASQAPAAARDVLGAEQAVMSEVAREHATRIPLHALVFAGLVAMLWRGRRAARRWLADDPSAASVAEVWSRPISSALVLACVAAPWIYPEATPLLGRVLALIAIVPVLRLIRPRSTACWPPRSTSSGCSSWWTRSARCSRPRRSSSTCSSSPR